MDQDITKRYNNGEITVEWRPSACIHSTVCWKATTGLPEVFNPRERPWIKLDKGETEKIIEQIKKCPSGALSYFHNEPQVGGSQVSSESQVDIAAVSSETHVEVIPNGPLMVYGNLTIKDKSGSETRKHSVTAFCRCGYSANKPYCDGSHIKAKFKD